MKAFVSTVPFAKFNQLPLELFDAAGIEYSINPLGRRLTEAELAEMIQGADILIAGTEHITDKVMASAPRLRLIARVGIGLDGIDLAAARARSIAVTYTPDAPAPAVAELTIGLMISLLRGVHTSNLEMHQRKWSRVQGRRIAEVTVGIIGAGRIGGRVIRRLSAFGTPRILVNDLRPDPVIAPNLKLEWVDKETIYRTADLISLHVPLTASTRNMIGAEQLEMMGPTSLLVNTARGGIVDESALTNALAMGQLGGAALDVFDDEPYSGMLCDEPRVLLTCHMGSMSEDCRSRMEIEAAEEAVRFAQGLELLRPVPDGEYVFQTESRSI